MRYSISIQTNEHSISLADSRTKKEALSLAAYWRGGGLSWKNSFTFTENPNIVLHDEKKDRIVYCQPMHKYALK